MPLVSNVRQRKETVNMDQRTAVSRHCLVAAGSGSFGVALLHVAVIFIGPWAYRYFGGWFGAFPFSALAWF